MNRRITKEIAEYASKRMAAKLYNSMIENVDYEIVSLGYLYAQRYIPCDVLKVLKAYPNYFNIARTLTFRCGKEGKMLEGINVTLEIPLPTYGRYINLNEDEYNQLYPLFKRKKDLTRRRDDFISNMKTTLYSLKYENKVKECLPEALNFMEFPPEKNLPVPVNTELRNLLKTIKDI